MSVRQNQQYIANLSYDVNPAMRFGLEYAHIRTKYANYLWSEGEPVAGKKGTLNTIRIGAWYFF
jgi:predicted porin